MLFCRILIVSAFSITTAAASAETIEGARIPARLECSALMPKRANDSAFVSPMTIIANRGQLSAERQRIVSNDTEKFNGTIDPLGRIEMVARYDAKQSWIYRLKGKLEEKTTTVLRGDVEITAGAVGRRSCTLTFLAKPDELITAFSR